MESQPKNALKIGGVCIGTYIISYYIRNLLSVLTPSMLRSGAYTEEYLALLASVYMIVYASGQLLNGITGDYIKPKYMVSLGLIISSLALFVFSFAGSLVLGIISFGAVGFGLSMLRGPLVKVISENTLPKYARICCTFLSFASFAGPLLAGLAAMIMKWHSVFVFSAVITLVMAVFSFLMLTGFEKCGIVAAIQLQKKQKEKTGILSIFKLHNFVPYMCIGMVVEIAAASINFWMPTYFNQYLSISEDTANMIFSAISLLRSLCPFISLFIFKLLAERDILLVRIAFSVSATLFLIMFFAEAAWLNIILLTLALMCSSIASATLWSIYIPSLGKSGKVSGANGIFDCSGYIAASIVNVAVVPVMNIMGWRGVILSWCAVMLFGVASTLFAKTKPQ